MIKCDIFISPQMLYTNDGNIDQQYMKCGKYILKEGELVYTLEDLKWDKLKWIKD